jgi:hypothetical protein
MYNFLFILSLLSHVQHTLKVLKLKSLKFKTRNAQHVSAYLSIKVIVTLRPTVSRSVSLGFEPHLGLMTAYSFLFDIYCFIDVGRPL